MAKVLVVDDSLSVRKVVERTLGTHGLQVVSVGSGTEAKSAIEREAPDLIVCDVILPDADGFEVCGFVRRDDRLRGIPILLMSGIINAKVKEQAARAQANDLMGKPFAADDLMRRATALLRLRGDAAANARTPDVRALPSPETRPPAPPPPPSSAAALPGGGPGATGLDGPLNAFLKELAALPGVRLAVVVDRDGFVISSANATETETETVGALVSCLKGPFEGVGEDLGIGAPQGIIVEHRCGIVLLQNIGGSAVIGAVLSDPTALGKVRYYVKRNLPILSSHA